MGECLPAESSGLDTCQTLSFCPNLSRSRCAGWRYLPALDGAAPGARSSKGWIIAESYQSGETVSAIARRYGLTPQQLFGWRRAAQRRAEHEADESGAAFAPVIVAAGPRGPEVPIAPVCSGGSPVIEIVIGSAIIRIPPGTDAATLQMVLRTVKATT